MLKTIEIIKNGKISTVELNNLLKTNNWEIDSEKIETLLEQSWCYLSARDKENNLIGFVHVLSDDIFHAYILRLIVHPDYRKCGIGSLIMERLMSILNENNLKPTLVSTPGNQSFYEKFGFKTDVKGLTAMCVR